VRASMSQMESAKSVRSEKLTQIYSKFSFNRNSPEAISKAICGACVNFDSSTHDTQISELFSKIQSMSKAGVSLETCQIFYWMKTSDMARLMPREMHDIAPAHQWPIGLGGIPFLSQTKICEGYGNF